MAKDELKKEGEEKKEKPLIEFEMDIGGIELGLILIAIGFALGWFLRNLV